MDDKNFQMGIRERAVMAAVVDDADLDIRNSNDVADMARLGKKQVFKRNFNYLSVFGWISIYMATWEFVLVSLAIGLSNGGFAGLFWTFIGTVICYSSVVLSLAEMASMAPTAGGQYHWTSEFAPPSCQKFLSYCAGWMSTLGWFASTASSVFVCTTLIQSLVGVRDEQYAFSNWQYTLLMLAFLAVTILFNTLGSGSLPLIETISLFGHVGGFFVTIIPIWIMAPKNSASDVFTSFSSTSGWNLGAACLVTQVSILYCNLGSDSIVHIAEEVNNASVTVPRVMWWSYVLNATLGFVALITMLFCIGSLDDAINSESPYLQLFLNTGSHAVAYVLLILLFLLIYSGNITCLATASREVFAFSRDKGFPFSHLWSKMNKKRHVPDNAVYITSIVSGIICLINLGSTIGFNIVVSLNLLALMSTYSLSIGCITLKRLRGEPLPPARWSLGRYGLPINVFGFFYSLFAVVLSCFPAYVPTDTSSANWAPAVWGAVAILSVVTYFLHGQKHYTPPVVFVEGKRVGGLQGTE
ncbi:hypothetical protein LTR05_005725 [Lithohypha guttulata]|uniref:Amino acid transporter n=1 Tax=Lithohypha guttulata TaxID=1690604 RepID=A0AAN7SYG8_9EURO|nr:hypothetical protein LTR05_005725 [Lithohypha guttulata]